LNEDTRCSYEPDLYYSLIKKSRFLREDDPLVKRAVKERPDLKDVLKNVPIHVVSGDELRRLTGQNISGMHYWTFNFDKGAKSLRIFVEDGEYAYNTLIHEACHAKIAKEYPEIFPFFSFETSETLAELCVNNKIPIVNRRVNFKIEDEFSELTMREGIKEAFKEAMWKLGKEKCEVEGKKAKDKLNQAITTVLDKALEIDFLDFSDREELKEAAEETRKICMKSKI